VLADDARQAAVGEVLVSIPGSGKDFYVCFFVLLLLCFYFFVQNILFVMTFCNYFSNVKSFSTLIMLQNL